MPLIKIKQGDMNAIKSGALLLHECEVGEIHIDQLHTVKISRNNTFGEKQGFTAVQKGKETTITVHNVGITGEITEAPILLYEENGVGVYLTLFARTVKEDMFVNYVVMSTEDVSEPTVDAASNPQKDSKPSPSKKASKPKTQSNKAETNKYKIYTDGACRGNPGSGGYCAIILHDGKETVVSGHEKNTTNNRMEMMAFIEALRTIRQPADIEILSDSQYVINGMSKGWAKSWKRNGWRKSDGKPALNTDLWEELLRVAEKHEIKYTWVKGHASNPYNNRCDAIAVQESHKASKRGH